MDDGEDIRLVDSAGAAPQARHLVAERLRKAGRTELIDEAELAISELVTNAVLHAGQPVHIRIRIGDVVRLEVRDVSWLAPVRPRADASAMTGRGLALVEAVSLRWGVEPRPDGKVVWAELGGTDAVVDGDEIDVDALLAAWADEEPVEDTVAVRIGDVSTELVLEAKSHVDNLVREFALATGGAEVGSGTQVPDQLRDLIERVVHRFGEVRQGMKRQALAAAAKGLERTELVLHVPRSAADDAEAYLDALDEVDAYARAARLLTLAAPPRHRVFRRWYIGKIVEQLREQALGQGEPGIRSFEHVLLDELDRTEEERRDLERVANLHEMTSSLGSAVSVEDVGRRVIVEGVRVLGAQAGLLIIPGGDGILSVPVSVGVDEDTLAFIRASTVEADLASVKVIRTGLPLWIESRAERRGHWPATSHFEPKTEAMCAVPLLVGERVLGCLGYIFHEPRMFDDNSRRVVTTLGVLSAQALDRVQWYQAEQQTRAREEVVAERLAQVQRVASALSRARTVEETTDVIITEAAEAIGAKTTTIALLSTPDMLEVVGMSGVRLNVRSRWQSFPVDAALPASEAVRKGLPVVAAGIAEIRERFPSLAGDMLEHTALVCLPLRVEGRVIGALALGLPDSQGLPDPVELEYLTALADSCGQAVERARLAHELEQLRHRMAVGSEVAEIWPAESEVRSGMKRTAHLVVPRLADWCVVDLTVGGVLERVTVLHRDEERLASALDVIRRSAAARRYAQDCAASRVAYRGQPELHTLTDGRGLLVEDDQEATAAVQECGIASAMIVPICGDESGALGALTLVRSEAGRGYNDEEMQFAEALGRYLGRAVEGIVARTPAEAVPDPRGPGQPV